ncbi:MAG: putative metallopeptidase [archaeon]
MGIKYTHAPDIQKIAEEIVEKLGWNHILLEHVAFIRSFGSSARRTIARCHALGKAMQIGMDRKKGFYLIEVISEKFDRLSSNEQLKVTIHELMHIPKSFGGGFIHHNKVHDKSVEQIYNHYCNLKKDASFYGSKNTSNDKEDKWF